MNQESNRNAYKTAVQAAAKEGIFVMADFHSRFNELNQANAIATWELLLIY